VEASLSGQGRLSARPVARRPVTAALLSMGSAIAAPCHTPRNRLRRDAAFALSRRAPRRDGMLPRSTRNSPAPVRGPPIPCSPTCDSGGTASMAFRRSDGTGGHISRRFRPRNVSAMWSMSLRSAGSGRTPQQRRNDVVARVSRTRRRPSYRRERFNPGQAAPVSSGPAPDAHPPTRTAAPRAGSTRPVRTVKW